MAHQRSRIEKALKNKQNQLIDLVQHAYAEGRRNAEANLTDKHSFKNVMRQWVRYKKEQGSDDCVISPYKINSMNDRLIEGIENSVLEWAENNPEPKEEKPKKTRWIDWLESQGLIVKFLDDNIPGGYSVELTDKLNEEIPEKFLEN